MQQRDGGWRKRRHPQVLKFKATKGKKGLMNNSTHFALLHRRIRGRGADKGTGPR